MALFFLPNPIRIRDKTLGEARMEHRPYLNYIRSFEAAARHLSFTLAAEELNYTQAAISNHVRSLEEYLGKPLFIRHARSLELTGPGQAYLPGIRRALHQIGDATEAIITRPHDQSLVISCPISLAENWLAVRVARFLAEYPDYAITLNGTIWADTTGEVADLTVEIKPQDKVALGDALLAPEHLTVVCAPEYQVGSEMLCRPDQLSRAQLIHILTRQDCWGRWRHVWAWIIWTCMAVSAQTRPMWRWNWRRTGWAAWLCCARWPGPILTATC
ncbi:LysR family transcriptional regulator [Rhodophyticola sp. CCM32]|nr:LysR family transcriptional regulator [Rhodophyticola sp. CCM32]